MMVVAQLCGLCHFSLLGFVEDTLNIDRAIMQRTKEWPLVAYKVFLGRRKQRK